MTPQELKNSILQLAIQGKLVEQRPEEGTGDEVYQKIQKHHKGLKPCKDELNFSAMDFELPETWKMVELNQLYNFIDYRGKTPIKSVEGVFLITASNIRRGYMDYTRKEYISSEEYDARKSRGITRKGDLLFTTEAPLGNAAICDLNECSCGQRIITFQEYEENTADPKLFMYFILSPHFQKQLLDNCTGTTAKGIKADKLKHLILPLPPLAEQKRIVAKIEELLPYIDRYEQAWSKLEQFNSRFPEDMKKSLLQYAIQGKLVEQRPEEGTAEELFDQIQQEKQRLIAEKKIKKEKPLPEITDDEKPFDIPGSWKWVRFSDLMNAMSTGPFGSMLHKSDYVSKGIPLVNPANIVNGKIIPSEKMMVSADTAKRLESYRLHTGMIVIGRRGEMGRCAVVGENQNGWLCGTGSFFLTPSSSLFVDYIQILFTTHYARAYLGGESVGTTMSNLNHKILSKMPVPLPPLAEQKRIVEKLEQLLPLCERLK